MSAANDVRIARARGEADAAKARLLATLDQVKARLAPGRIASDAVQGARDKGRAVADETVTAVKDRPLLAAGIATAAAALIARKPLMAAVGGWLGGDRGPLDDDDTNRPHEQTRRASARPEKE